MQKTNDTTPVDHQKYRDKIYETHDRVTPYKLGFKEGYEGCVFDNPYSNKQQKERFSEGFAAGVSNKKRNKAREQDRMDRYGAEDQPIPGPWFANGAFVLSDKEHLFGNGHIFVATVSKFTQRPATKKEIATARLIAAAPELLEATKAARDVIATAIRANWEGATDDDISNHVTIKRLDSAIAKAIGG